MITLQSPELLVRLDPAHGGEMLDLIDLSSGRQLLGRPPFGCEPILDGDLDEDRWTQSYRGGWQTLSPNAGAPASRAAGERCTMAENHRAEPRVPRITKTSVPLIGAER